MAKKILFTENLSRFLVDIKLTDVVCLDISQKSDIAHFFFLATFNSTTHARSCCSQIKQFLIKNGLSCRIEGENSSLWMLVDGGDTVVHLFSKKGREYYNLEDLWSF